MTPRKVCPQCGASYGAESRFCSVDGATLVLEQPADELVGRIVADRYHVLERLGIGGMGEVFLAEHVRMKRKSALKIMREALTSDPIAVSRFHREAENASQINHPNVAAVYDFGETSDGLVYIAMEYVRGEAMSDVLEREKALNPARVADIIGQAGDALSAAHALGILHRDLKPDNIMLAATRWGTDLVKIVDFGISRAMESATQQFTSTGMIVGTPDYMSPEQLTGDALDARSDQYALGLIAYVALTGRFPFPAGASKDALLTRLTSTPQTLAQTLPDVNWPPALQAALDRALAADVTQRYDDVHDFARDFELAIAEMPGSESMERYRDAQRQRFATPTRGPSVTPPRAIPSIEATRVRPLPSVAGSVAETPPGEPATEAGAAPEATPAATLPPRTTAASGRRGRRLTGVVAAIALTAIVVWRLAAAREGVVVGNVAPAADSVVTDSTPMPNASTIADAPPSAAAPAIDSAAALARSGVFAIYGEGTQGSAFLVDPAGIVITALDFTGATEARVQLGPDRRVVARVMAVDSARRLAALRIPIQHCQGCAVLRVSGDATRRLTPGDSVVIPAALTRSGSAVEARGTVTRAEGRTLETSLRLSDRGNGAPILTADGALAGVAMQRGRRASYVGVEAITALHTAARRRRMEVLPNDTLVPTWPATPVARNALRDAASRSDAQVQSFQTAAEGFAVFVMTPQIMAWRQDRIRGEIEAARVMSLDNSGPVRVVDPVQLWREWDTYLSERRAVVVLHATPELAGYGRLNRRVVTDLRRGDVAELRLFRDGQLVRPIEAARTPAVVNAEAYRAAGQYVYSAGVAVYRPRDFAPGDGGRAPELRVEIVDGRSRRASSIRLPDAAVAAVQRDLATYLR